MDKERIVTSKQMNRLKVENYGKWFIKPEEFNKKVIKLNKNF
jgi:hypothetical protein